MILIFSYCPEKAHDNKEISLEVLKPSRESRPFTSSPESG